MIFGTSIGDRRLPKAISSDWTAMIVGRNTGPETLNTDIHNLRETGPRKVSSAFH